MHTLVLDQGYLPQRIVTWQAAVSLLYVGKAELVDQHEQEVCSPSVRMRAPSIVRLVRASRRYRGPLRFSRRRVLQRDGYRCQYCGVQKHVSELTCDHVLPRSRGGRESWENLVAACRACNLAKAARTPEEAGLALLSRPSAPRWLPPLRTRASAAMPAAWRVFLVGTCL